MGKTSIKLYLIRHGESLINIDSHLVSGRSNGSPLTQYGIKQSEELGRHLRGCGIVPTKVYSSPALRALQTASRTLGVMKLKAVLTIDDALQELDQGDWVGQLRRDVYSESTLAEIKRKGKNFKAPNGESMNQVGARMLEWVNKLATEARLGDTEHIFAFTHGIAISCLASSMYNWSHAKTYQSAVENTSISLFEYQKNHWRLVYFAVHPNCLNQLA